MMACFGATISRDKAERNHRFLEEALELVQACGCTESEAAQLVAYVYGRPAGDPPQEVGGVMVPDYRGYANLGTGQYLLNISGADEPPELIISIASDEEKAGRTVGDLRDNQPGTVIQPEQMAVRLRFASEAGLAALEQQLRILREERFAAAAGDKPGA